MDELKEWLRTLGLDKYAAVFAENEVDHEILPELTDQDLKELGIPLGPRKKLLKGIAALSEKDAGIAEAVSPSSKAVSTVLASAGASEGERRQLTVMFCDLVGSTALSVRFDPEDLRELIRGYRDCCMNIIERFEGSVARYLGDGLLVYFGYPQAHENDPERAVQAGLEIVTAVAQLNPWPNLKLQTRVGIATGMVVADLIGSAASEEQDVVGETPNLAARLQGLAEPDTVVIADSSKRLAGGLFEYLDLGRHHLKGFGQPIQAWRVVGKRLVASRFEATHVVTELTPLVGREEEVELLHRRWQQVKTGESQVVLLLGEPGIGKSRIAQHLEEHLNGEPHIVLRYYCSPYYQNTALFPMIDQLERAVRFSRKDTLEEKLDKLEALLAQAAANVSEVAPLFAALLSLPTEGRYPPLDLSPQRHKEKTLEALVAQLAGLASKQPVFVVFEDLHWIDPTTLELLERTVDRAQALPVLLLMTFRPNFVAPWIGYPHVTALTLSRLSHAKVTEIIAKVTGGKTLPPDVLDQIVAKTDGVPLFVEELTKTVLEAGFLKDEGDRYAQSGPIPPLAVPSTLQDSLMARLDRLAPVKEIVQIGAVIGRQFSYELLAEVAPLKDPELQDALNQLAEAELIYRRGTPPQSSYTFKHALVQDAAYASLLRNKKQTLHARIAKVLEERFAERVDTEPELLARHYTGAGLAPKAVEYWLKAGQRASERSAYTEALAHLTAGLELLSSLSASAERNRQELQLQTARAAALQATRGFGAPETGQAYARARELCAQLGEAPEIFPVLHGVFLFHMLQGDVKLGYDAAKECLRQAQRQNDGTPLLFGHRTVGSGLLHLGEFGAARDHLRKMLVLAEAKHPAASASVYGIEPRTAAPAFLSLTLFALGYPDQAEAAAADALSRAERLGHLQNLGYALYWANMTALQRREFAAVGERSQRLIALEEQGFSQWAAFGTFQHGVALAGLGDSEAGIRQMRRGLSDYRALGSRLYRPFMLACLAITLAHAGHSEEAMGALAEALAQAENTQERWFKAELHRLQGELLLLQGGPEAVTEAEACLRQALTIARRQSARAWELRAATSLARLWRDQEKREEARGLLNPLYNGFTEGFGTADLQDAKRLLEELA